MGPISLNYRGLLQTFYTLRTNRLSFLNSLPPDVLEQICTYVHPRAAPVLYIRSAPAQCLQERHPAEIPPATGECYLLKLPLEIRNKIFASALPARNITIEPMCDDHKRPKAHIRKARRNKTIALMRLNKQIKQEVTHVIYEERTFRIHVHQDLKDGGIEFLDAGRQPLQYQDNVNDNRFRRFQSGDEFGFARLKKIEIVIFSVNGDSKHCAMNTYYMNLALVKMLERGGGERNMINSIAIIFQEAEWCTKARGRRAIMRGENFWWDADAGVPRCTSTFGVPDIEFVLRPFANLRSHNVLIILPSEFAAHESTISFLKGLENSMRTGHLFDANMEHFELHMNLQRDAFEEHQFRRKHGHPAAGEYKWTEREWMEADGGKALDDYKTFQNPTLAEANNLELTERQRT